MQKSHNTRFAVVAWFVELQLVDKSCFSKFYRYIFSLSLSRKAYSRNVCELVA